MKNIEDCLERLDNILMSYPISAPKGYVHVTKRVSEWDQKFISDVSTHTRTGSALSSAQATTLLKILSKNIKEFPPSEQLTVMGFVAIPKYRQPLYASLEFPREVRWAGSATLLFRFRYNAAIVADLRDLSASLPTLFAPQMVRPLKLWKILVDNSNHKQVMNLIKKHNFNFDDNVLELFLHITNNLDKQSSIQVTPDSFDVEINNDIFSTILLEEMDWLKDV